MAVLRSLSQFHSLTRKKKKLEEMIIVMENYYTQKNTPLSRARASSSAAAWQLLAWKVMQMAAISHSPSFLLQLLNALLHWRNSEHIDTFAMDYFSPIFSTRALLLLLLLQTRNWGHDSILVKTFVLLVRKWKMNPLAVCFSYSAPPDVCLAAKRFPNFVVSAFYYNWCSSFLVW